MELHLNGYVPFSYLQINVPGLFALDFTYDPPDPLVNNNGSIHTQQIRANAQLDVTQTYTYDAVNRLSSVTEGGWSRNYYYDAFGNRAVQGAGVAVNYPQCALATDPNCGTSDFTADNRLSGTFAGYDSAGNQNVLKYPGNPLFSASTAYDAHNKQRYFCDGTELTCPAAGVTGEYRYDAGGNRVEKIVGANTTTYVYDAFGQVAAEYETAPTTTGREPGRFFRTSDHLGSTRLVTRADGSVKTRRDFFPFGEEILANATYGNRQNVTDLQPDTSQAATYQLFGATSDYSQQFTAKERDDESGLDYFGARYFSASLGRFTGPDRPFADQFSVDPQSWNLFTYTRNNPLRYVDQNGNYIETAWDIANVGLGVASFVDNVRQGNYGSAALDAVGVVLDAAAVVAPLVPAGAGAIINGARGANRLDNAIDAARTVDRVDDASDAGKAASKGADFVVTPDGQGIPTSQSRMREGFDEAGFPSKPAESPGIETTLPDGSRVRTMEPSGQAPRRASFENANGGPIDPSTGKPPQPPKSLTPAERRQYVRERTHIEQEP